MNGLGDFVEGNWRTLKTMPPLVYFTSMALLCVLPVPISPFYVAAGPLFGLGPSLAWIGGAIVLNQIVAHWLSAGLFRTSIERFLNARGHAIPTPKTKSEERLLIALVRVTPGLPYALQNWTLGLAGTERRRYLMISWPIQMLHATAWVLLGQSAFEGQMGVSILAISLILILMIGARWASLRLRAAQNEEDIASPQH